MEKNYEGGVWRTIKGRRVFIRDGEDLSSAMKRSGKFDNLKREDVVKAKQELEIQRTKEQTKHFKRQENLSRTKRDKKDYHDRWSVAQEEEREAEFMAKFYDNPRENQGIMSDLAGKHINGRKYQIVNGNIKNAYDGELRDISKGYATNINTDETNKKEQADLRKMAKIEMKTRQERAREIDKINSDTYQSKVFGTDVTIMDKQMKSLFGEDFKYAEDKMLKGEYNGIKYEFDNEEKVQQFQNAVDKKGKYKGMGYSQRMNQFVKDVSPMSEYSDTTGTGLSDKQSTALAKMSMSKLTNTAKEYGIDTKGLSRQQLIAKLIAIFNK